MKENFTQKFHFNKNYGYYLGSLTENKLHKHFALQISISSKGVLTLKDSQGITYTSKGFFVNSNVEHELLSTNNQLTILVNPLSPIGHKLVLKNKHEKIQPLNQPFFDSLSIILTHYELGRFSFCEFTNSVNKILDTFHCSCEDENHYKDDRIVKVLDFLDQNFINIISLQEAADYCYLSTSRFLHLFKEKTQLSFRRYQLWNKLIKSIPYLLENSVTKTGYKYGFSDSSHYTKTFKETFGILPNSIKKRK